MSTLSIYRALTATAAATILLLSSSASVTSATKLHVNSGCITYVDYYGTEHSACASCNPIDISEGTTTIYAGYAGLQNSAVDVPSLHSDFAWPSTYGDIYFGADNCLYDSNAQQISGQCAGPNDSGDEHPNPYYPDNYCAR